LNHFLRQSSRLARRRWTLTNSAGWTISLSYIEPFKVPNGGLLLCKGRDRLCSYCQRNGIRSPIAIHLNFHLPESAKGRTLRILVLNVSQSSCPHSLTWSFWGTCQWPNALQCNDWFISRR
jgi:hypothetical protein